MWGGGCREVGVSVGVGGGCRCGEVGVGMENPTPVQNFTYLEPDSIISSLFVQSVIFHHTLCGLLNKLVGVGRYVCEEVGVGRWVWVGGCGEVVVGVGRWLWVWGGGCGCGEVCV